MACEVADALEEQERCVARCRVISAELLRSVQVVEDGCEGEGTGPWPFARTG